MAKDSLKLAARFDVKYGEPQSVLVDKEGKIVFIGHPMNRNFEEDITQLIDN